MGWGESKIQWCNAEKYDSWTYHYDSKFEIADVQFLMQSMMHDHLVSDGKNYTLDEINSKFKDAHIDGIRVSHIDLSGKFLSHPYFDFLTFVELVDLPMHGNWCLIDYIPKNVNRLKIYCNEHMVLDDEFWMCLAHKKKLKSLELKSTGVPKIQCNQDTFAILDNIGAENLYISDPILICIKRARWILSCEQLIIVLVFIILSVAIILFA